MSTAVLVLALATSAMAASTEHLHYTITDLGTLGGNYTEVNPTTTVNWSRLSSCDESNRPNGFSVEST